MPRNWQSSLNFFSRLGIVLLSNSKLFFVLSQMFDKRKIYLNVGYLISLRSAINFKQYALLWVISIAMRFQYDEGIGKVWIRFEFTNYCACEQGQNIATSVFRKKTKKGTEKGKINIYCFYEIILLFKSIQEERTQILFSLLRTPSVKGLLRMLRP